MTVARTATRARRVRARVEGTVQGVGFRPYVYRLAGGARPRAASCCNDARGVLVEVEGERRPASAFLAAPAGRGAAAGGGRARVAEELPSRPASPGFAIRASPPAGEPDARVSAGHRHLRRLPARAVRPGRPPLPLPVHQLHQLRPALHDRARRPLRPAAHDDGRLRDVRRLPAPSTTTRPTAASTPSRTPARSAGRALRLDGARRGDDPRRAAAAALRGGAIVAVKGLGGFHLACRADDEAAVARAARAQAPRGQAVRADGRRSWRPRASSCTLDAARTSAADSRERPIVLAPAARGAPVARRWRRARATSA